jgi:hypothetical protein
VQAHGGGARTPGAADPRGGGDDRRVVCVEPHGRRGERWRILLVDAAIATREGEAVQGAWRRNGATWVAAVVLIGALVWSPGAMAIEEPPYRVVERDGSYELREYAAYLLAETRVEAPFLDAGNIAFGRLFRYISGNNQAQQKIAMTAPVTQAPAAAARGRGEKIAMTAPVNQVADGDAFLVGFVVPAKYTRDTVPQPLDPAVKIREVPAQLTASWRYSGRWTEANFQAALDELRAVLKTRGLAIAGEPVIARYNPPFMPTFLRRNEVLVPVQRVAAVGATTH